MFCDLSPPNSNQLSLEVDDTMTANNSLNVFIKCLFTLYLAQIVHFAKADVSASKASL